MTYPKTELTATLPSDNAMCGINTAHRKENRFVRSYLLIGALDGDMTNLLDVRFYNTETRSYCCVWLHGARHYTSGSGTAGGYGYHKDSEAFSRAVDSAGIGLSADVGGMGDTAIVDVMIAIGKALGYERDNLRVFQAHG